MITSSGCGILPSNSNFGQGQTNENSCLKLAALTSQGQAWLTNEAGLRNQAAPYLGRRLRVLSKIGRGGMGTVYLAYNRELEQAVAVKVLHPEFSSDMCLVERFRRDAEIAAEMMHPNIVTVYGQGMTGEGAPYAVMEFVPGVSLATVLSRQVHLDVGEAVNTFIQICDALSHGHDQGVVHGDLKPGNVILSRDESGSDLVKLSYFGLSKMPAGSWRDSRCSFGESDADASETPRYFSPEHCLGMRLDNRSDIYSLGCLMYRVLTGGNLFNGATVGEVIGQQLYQEPPRLFGRKLPIRTHLEIVVDRCLRKEPGERYPDVNVLSRQLRSIYQQHKDSWKRSPNSPVMDQVA